MNFTEQFSLADTPIARVIQDQGYLRIPRSAFDDVLERQRAAPRVRNQPEVIRQKSCFFNGKFQLLTEPIQVRAALPWQYP